MSEQHQSHPREARPGGRRLDAALHLMDRQIVDPNGWLAGKVDDVELSPQEDGTLIVTAILTGPGALGPRLPGLIGRIATSTWRRLHTGIDPHPGRIDFDHITEIASAIRVSLPREELPNHTLEQWTRRQIIGKLPGAQHAPE